MKVLSIESILDIKNSMDFNNNNILNEILSNYHISNKVNKVTKKKNLLNKINFDIQYQNFEVSKFDNKFKSILIAFNKLSKDNVNIVIDDLKKIVIDDYNLLSKVTDFLCKKAIYEQHFSHLYIILIEELTNCSKWIVKFNDKFIVTIKDIIILNLQHFFESQLDNTDKDTGILYFKFLSKIYDKKWIDEEVFNIIIRYLLYKNNQLYYEYIITFLKGCQFKNINDIKEILTQKSLPMRLKFLLEEI